MSAYTVSLPEIQQAPAYIYWRTDRVYADLFDEEKRLLYASAGEIEGKEVGDAYQFPAYYPHWTVDCPQFDPLAMQPWGYISSSGYRVCGGMGVVDHGNTWVYTSSESSQGCLGDFLYRA